MQRTPHTAREQGTNNSSTSPLAPRAALLQGRPFVCPSSRCLTTGGVSAIKPRTRSVGLIWAVLCERVPELLSNMKVKLIRPYLCIYVDCALYVSCLIPVPGNLMPVYPSPRVVALCIQLYKKGQATLLFVSF